jgi:ankyrin repeat protein
MSFLKRIFGGGKTKCPPTQNQTGDSKACPPGQQTSVEVTSDRLLVSNLSFDATESDISKLFNSSGVVKNAEVVVDKLTKRSKGFAFVTMTSIEDAKKAVADLHNKEFMGRPLAISGVKPSVAPVTPHNPATPQQGHAAISPDQSASFFEAAQNGNLEKIKALLNNNSDLVFSKDKDGRTALHWTAFKGYKGIVELLLANKAEVNAKGNNGMTPLHTAATGGHKDIVELLLANKAEINGKDNKGYTPLHHAASFGQKNVVVVLLASRAEVNAKGNDGMTPLHWAAALKGDKEVVTLLLANGADVNAKGNNELTPLRMAEANGHEGVAELLRHHSSQQPTGTSQVREPAPQAMQCDICSRPGSGTIVPAKQFSDAVMKGFNAIRHCDLPIVLSEEAKAYHAERWTKSATSGDTSHSDWNVCSSCLSALSPYLADAASKQESAPAVVQSATSAATQAVKVFEKNADGSFTETKGDLSLAPVLFAKAESLYKKVMQAARSNRIMPDDEQDLTACINFLTKLIEVDPIRGSGAPNAMRAAMYFISAQVNRRKDQLDKAESDYLKAIEIGDSDPSNLANWRESLEQIRTVRGIL